MLWVQNEYKYSCIQKLFLNILKQGILPKHIGFIMDGNRRFANVQGMETTEGHNKGFLRLSDTLQWCNDFGVEEVSLFTFSIDNFSRSDSEVAFLMKLAVEKFQELLEKGDELMQRGVRIRIIGNLTLLPVKLQRLSAKLMLMTQHNTRATLNFLMAYSTSDELANAVDSIRRGVQTGIILESDISPDLISKCSYLRSTRPLDVLVRTSGESRLSEFMVWQAALSFSTFKFVKVYWPEFSFWHLVAAILQFQLNKMLLVNHTIGIANGYTTLSTVKKAVLEKENRLTGFFHMVDHDSYLQLKSMALLEEPTLAEFSSESVILQTSACSS